MPAAYDETTRTTDDRDPFRVLDDYELVDKREGGTSIVYICDSSSFDRRVAIKEPREELLADPRVRRRFLEECHVWSLLGSHPNIVRVWMLHLISGSRPQLVLEYVESSLAARLSTRHETAWIVRLGLQVCDALIHCGLVRSGFVHGDLTPSNVLLTPDDTAKVTDFGLARVLGPEALSVNRAAGEGGSIAFPGIDQIGTDDGLHGGSWAYMSPEQLRRDRSIDARSDLYALGCLLYELLAGRRAFRHTSRRHDETMHLLDPIPDLPADRASAPLNSLVHRCLANDPAERPVGFRELRDTLARLALVEFDVRVPEPEGEPSGLDPNILMALLKLGDLDTVERICEETTDRSPREEAWREHVRGRLARARGEAERAIEHFERALSLADEPNPAEQVFHLASLANAHADAGHLDCAIQIQERVIEIQPKIAAGWHNLGLSYRQADRHEDGIRCLEKARRLAADPVHFVALAKALSSVRRDYEGARRELNRAMGVDPNVADVHLEFASVSVTEVWRHFEAQGTMPAGAGELLAAAADHLFTAKRLGAAADQVETVHRLVETLAVIVLKIRIERDDAGGASGLPSLPASVWSDVAGQLIPVGRAGDAVLAASLALLVDPSHYAAANNRGTAHQHLGRFEDAAAAYDDAIAADPERPEAWYGKATSLARTDRRAEALGCFDRALALRPDHAESWCDKGMSLLELGRWNDAMRAFDRAIEIDATLARAWYGKGGVLVNGMHLLREGHACLVRALELGHLDAKSAIAQIEAHLERGAT